MNQDIGALYKDNLNKYQVEYDRTQTRYTFIAYLRLAIFLVGAVCTYLLFPAGTYLALGVGIVFLTGFLLIVKYHAKLAQQQNYRSYLIQINQRELEALAGDYSAFDAGASFIDPTHPYSYDLDIFGQRSIYQYLNRTVTLLGQQRLADWVQNPFQQAGDIRQQQEAVQAITGDLDWAQRFQALGFEKLESSEDLKRLQEWLETPSHYFNKPTWRIWLWVLPALWVVLGIVALAGLHPSLSWQIGWQFPSFLFLLYLGIVGRHVNRTNKVQAQVGKQSRMLEKFSELFRHVEEAPFSGEKLNELQEKLAPHGVKSSEAIAQLGAITGNLDQRLNMIAGILLNGFVLWDLQIMYRLEAWKAQYREHVQAWFENLGEWDALISLSRLAVNHPDYCWPDPVEGPPCISAQGLGHPFIQSGDRVGNDLLLESSGTFWLVTGANMAGKSTYLRSVGVNLVLAMIGAPVCAQQLTFTPIPIITSMRATDSLQDQTSYFYAELKRLKYIIDLLREGGPTFIMVDEMLRGTNSRDKQTGSKRFIEQLVQLKGMGLIATHDLALGELQDLYPGQVYNKRFEVAIEEGGLSFDYKLQEGLSQNLNATYLMEEMGIM